LVPDDPGSPSTERPDGVDDDLHIPNNPVNVIFVRHIYHNGVDTPATQRAQEIIQLGLRACAENEGETGRGSMLRVTVEVTRNEATREPYRIPVLAFGVRETQKMGVLKYLLRPERGCLQTERT
jgi:hypothetical protein